MNEFSKLKDVSKLITKGTTPTSVGGSFTEKGINFIKSESITGSKFLNNSVFAFIDDSTDLKLKRSRIKTNDLLFSIAGAYLGKISIVQECDVPANTNQAVGIVRVDQSLADVNYLYYYFFQNSVNEYINKLSSQSSQPNLNLELLGNLEFKSRKLESQQKIATVLSALDDKIELNNQINTELEAMAKTLYDYWFVQFDFPDENGKPYQSSGGKMVFNDILKREIPVGWEVKSLYQIANFINGLACQKFRPENEDDEFLLVIKIREMNDGISGNTEKVRLNIPEKNIINDGDVLFSWSATLDVKIWTEGKAGLNQHIFKVISDKFPRSFYYFETLNYLQHFKMMAELRKTTMGHITIDHLKASYIPIPPIEMVKTLDGKLKPILEKVISNKKQNQELAKLRDWLLPMLMNGQVRVGSGEYEREEDGLGMVGEGKREYKKI